MIGDSLDDFLMLHEFAIAVTFTSIAGDVIVKGIFDKRGTVINGLVLEAARLIGEKSTVNRGWTCSIDGEAYVVLYVENGTGDFCEYFMRNVTVAQDRDIE